MKKALIVAAVFSKGCLIEWGKVMVGSSIVVIPLFAATYSFLRWTPWGKNMLRNYEDNQMAAFAAYETKKQAA